MAKFSACMIVLNEEEYMDYSLEVLLKCPHVTQILIVEGAVKNASHMATPDGHSIDNTLLKAQEYERKYEKVKLITKNGLWEDKREMRNAHTKLITPNNVMIIDDADEVFEPKDLDKFADQVDKNPHILLFNIKHIHFWKNFRQITIGSTWDTVHFRAFRMIPSLPISFKLHHAVPMDYLDRPVYANSFYYKNLTMNTGISLYHFGPVKKRTNVLNKLQYYTRRGQKIVDTYTDWQEGKPTQWSAGGGRVIPYSGHIPEIMKKHPYYNIDDVQNIK